MDKDTRPKGWHDDFASDRPEHARRQSLRPQVEQAKQAIAELPESVRANAHMEGCHHEGFASPTGPDTRQAEELRLGQRVMVNSNAQYAEDYQGEVWRVIGLELKKDGKVNVTIALASSDGMSGWRGWDDATDGFSPDMLTPAPPESEND